MHGQDAYTGCRRTEWIKIGEKSMKDKIFGVLQRVGRSFMLPIAVLPVAGLLGIGSSFTNPTTIATYGLGRILGDGTVLNALLVIMSKAGSVIFDNLPIIFAVGVAIGMAKAEKEVAALSRHDSVRSCICQSMQCLPFQVKYFRTEASHRGPGRNHCIRAACRPFRWECSAVSSGLGV